MSVRTVVGGGVLIVFGLLLAVAPAVAEDESDMAGVAATFQEEYNAGNFAAVTALYSEDGCRMPPNADIVYGSDAILGFLEASDEAGMVKIEVSVISAITSGDMGWAEGTYTLLAEDGSEVDHGKWLNTSKNVDGMWKIHCDIWNSNVPLEVTE
jgi:ketosteroid isomerase-like protein